jgi:hypothetical protein
VLLLVALDICQDMAADWDRQNRRYKFIAEVYQNLPSTRLSEALLGFHAITGCDMLSYFASHTKNTACQTFKDHWKLLSELGHASLDDKILANAGAFICRLNSINTTDSTY